MPNAPDPTEARSKDVDTKQISAAPPPANHSRMPNWRAGIISHAIFASSPDIMQTPGAYDKLANIFLDFFDEIAPKTVIENMLVSHIILTHEQTMKCLQAANSAKQTFEGCREYLKHAEKLMMVHAQLVEALDKHRGNGQQQITVQRVNVASGGQAVVGNVNTGKRTMAKSADKNAQNSKGIEHQHQDNASFDLPSQTKEIDGVLLEDDDIC